MSVLLDENGLNANINCKILEPEVMEKFGFVKKERHWLFFKPLCVDIWMSITIYEDSDKRPEIDIIDDQICQPYDYQEILRQHPSARFATIVKTLVEIELSKLSDAGIVTGFVQGEYV